MLDLQPIKDRLAAATPGPWMLTFDDNRLRTSWALVRTDADLIANAPADLAALVTEVERLRDAIEAHREQCHKTYKVAQAWWDEGLWAVLDA